MDNHFALAQLCQEVVWAFEGFHFDEDAADLCERVGVGTGAVGTLSTAAMKFLIIPPPVPAAVQTKRDAIDLGGISPMISILTRVAPPRADHFAAHQASPVE